MFFVIAGVQPKTVTLDNQPRMCPSCGLYQAGLKRVDHYISVFFLPVFRVKKGTPFLQCQRCGSVSTESEGIRPGVPEKAGQACPNCGKPLEPTFRFCPFCGRQV
ncbi:MAG: zinc ribbon domain-containing protein [Desulfobacteraceae bacterium]|nr:MAG: zinc ribbon domain-containing protein [Desulfobacteraceae bacterium]